MGYRMEFNVKVLAMQIWNVPTDRAQRLDEKNGVISLFIKFTPRVTVIKMSKTTHLVFSADDSKKFSHRYGKMLSASERPSLFLLQNAMDYWVLSYHYQDVNTWYFLLTQRFFHISKFNISQMVTPKLMNHIIFWKKSIRPLRYT